jgi:hypothetical protein
MMPHLIGCTKVNPEVRDRAKDAKNKANMENTLPIGLRTSLTPSISCAGTPTSSRAPLSSIQLGQGSSNLTFSAMPDRSATPSDSHPVKCLCSEEWTANHQQEFAADLLKVFILAGIPWNAASDLEMNLFFDKWVPGSKCQVDGSCQDSCLTRRQWRLKVG